MRLSLTIAQDLRDFGLTDVGRVREHNEDALVRRPSAGLWAVADGMGGLERGEWASGVIAEALERCKLPGGLDEAAAALAQTLETANAEIFAQGQALGSDIGSTVVALVLREDRFALAWAGDSRAYRWKAGKIEQLSTDHTWVEARVAAGLISPADARHHPMGHILTRAVGIDEELELQTLEGEAAPGEVFLLCSDGLTGVVSDAELALGLSARDLDGSCKRLLDLCLARGAPDNVTMIAVALD